MPEIITAAADHPDLLPFITLRRSDVRVPDGCFIGDGRKVVKRMLASPLRLRTIVLTQQWLDVFGEAIKARPESDLKILLTPHEVVNGIIGYKVHQGVMALAETPKPPELPALAQTHRPLIVALDGVSDAENVGAILRTCAAFDVTGVIIGPTTCSPWLRRAVRVSLGAVLRVPVHFSKDLPATLRDLAARGVLSYAAHIHGENKASWETDFKGASCIVLGGEADGVTDAVIAACKHVVYIPMAPGWDCLNVTASASALLYEAARARK